MKKFFVLLIALIVIVGGGVYYAINKYVNEDEIRARVVSVVKEKTGRDIAFSRLRAMPFVNPVPYLMLKLQDVTLSNASWASEHSMMTLGSLEIQIALKPLLDKKIEIKKFILDKPVINLEVSLDGKKNWEIPKAKKEAEDGGSAMPAQVGQAVEGFKKDLKFSFSQFELRKGQVSFVDRRSRNGVLLDKIDLTANYPDFSSDIELDGWLEYLGKRVNLFAHFDKPLDLVNGATSPGKVTIKSEGLTDVSAQGKFSTSGTMLLGTIKADLPSLPAFVAWLSATPEKKLPFTHVGFSSQAALSAAALKLNGAKLDLDEVKADGDVTLGLATPKPDFKAQVSLNKLNLDRFTGGPKEESAAPAQVDTAAAARAEWDDTPINFAGLREVNADLVLNTKGFSLRGADVGPSTLTVQLKDGLLHFKSSEATLFGGKFLSDLSLNAAGKTAGMSFKFGMNDVDAKPVLTTFAKFDKLSGKVDAMVDVTSSGSSQRSLINNLSGDGNFDFKNGSLKGIDLVSIMSSIQSRLAQMDVGGGKTDFVDLSGTFKIANGVATNSDLKMKGPLVQTTGAGTVDLPKKFVKYRALPVLTASSAVENAKGLQVPVDIHGPFDNIKVNPDYKAVVSNLFEHPEDVKDTVKNVREEGQQLYKDFKKDPNAALNNLLGGGLFGKKKKAPVQDPGMDPNDPNAPVGDPNAPVADPNADPYGDPNTAPPPP